jgi:hypothetical protein
LEELVAVIGSSDAVELKTSIPESLQRSGTAAL